LHGNYSDFDIPMESEKSSSFCFRESSQEKSLHIKRIAQTVGYFMGRYAKAA
jgi:hypothetical protein